MPGFPVNGYNVAKDDCARRGGVLAAVHNRMTNDFLAASFSLLREQKFWLGGMLNTSNDPYGWQWIDKSPFNYTNWAPGMLPTSVRKRNDPSNAQLQVRRSTPPLPVIRLSTNFECCSMPAMGFGMPPGT